ncbi:MAG: molybdenum cofactor guanylyltransferase [Candidatus Humimicrobiaceae bacterium]
MDISGVVLAGGKGRRFNGDKINLSIGKVPMYLNQVFKLSLLTRDIVISTSQKNVKKVSQQVSRIKEYKNSYFQDFNLPELRVIKDENLLKVKRGIGPIGGVYSGIKESKYFYSLIIAMDMPLVSYKVLRMLICNISYGYDAVIIRRVKGLEVLCGIYSKNCLEAIKKNIDSGIFKISEIFKNINVKYIDGNLLEELNFLNINTELDFKKFRELWDNLPYDDFSSKWKNLFYR